MIIVLTILVAMMGLCVYLLVRNHQVYRHQMDMLSAVSKASRADIEAGRDYTWRYKEFDQVEYVDQLIKFWRPLNSFWVKSPARAEQ